MLNVNYHVENQYENAFVIINEIINKYICHIQNKVDPERIVPTQEMRVLGAILGQSLNPEVSVNVIYNVAGFS